MVKSVQDTFVGPGVRRWVEAFVSEMAGVCFANEGESAVEMGVPGDGADCECRGGRESEPGV